MKPWMIVGLLSLVVSLPLASVTDLKGGPVGHSDAGLQLAQLPASAPTAPSHPTQQCVKTGERANGLTKQCFYNCSGIGEVATVASTTACPATLRK